MMMLAGGVGNLVDRIAYGYVRDFIDYTVVETLFHKSFAICNVADVWLTVGMILLVVYVIFFWRDSNKKGYDEPKPDAYQVETAQRLLNIDRARVVDPAQVVFKEAEKEDSVDNQEDGAAFGDSTEEGENAESKPDADEGTGE